MFNGIIKNIGKINRIYKRDKNCIIEISSKMKFTRDEIGLSSKDENRPLTIKSYDVKISSDDKKIK